MDRRGFLKTTGTGAAAVIAGGASAARAEPPVVTGARKLSLASAWAGDLPGAGAERLAWRIETATGGRYRIEMIAEASHADLTYGADSSGLHPAFGVFAGLPFDQGLDASAHATWLAAGGGQMLWDELAAQFGFKPLIAGHTGPSGGLWSRVALDGAADLAGIRIHVTGLGAEVVRTLGATPIALPPQEIKPALAEGRVQAAEWLGPLGALAPDLEPLAERLYQPGLTHAGAVLALNVRHGLWQSMSAADRAIFEACAAQEFQLSLADVQVDALMAGQIASPAHPPARGAMPPQLVRAIEAAAGDVVASIAGVDTAARQIADSFQVFRRMFEHAPTLAV